MIMTRSLASAHPLAVQRHEFLSDARKRVSTPRVGRPCIADGVVDNFAARSLAMRETLLDFSGALLFFSNLCSLRRVHPSVAGFNSTLHVPFCLISSPTKSTSH